MFLIGLIVVAIIVVIILSAVGMTPQSAVEDALKWKMKYYLLFLYKSIYI